MTEELSQIDELSEADMMSALGQTVEDEILIEDIEDIQDKTVVKDDQNITEVSLDNITTLLSQLLKHKTIEITIKIKD